MAGWIQGRAVPALVATLAVVALRGDDARADVKVAPVSLFVRAGGFRNTTGQAIVALYDSKDTWLKIERAHRVVKMGIPGAALSASFLDIAPGVYAVSVIHDENANGKLDMHWFPVPGPDEGAGVSNDATATFGPPSFSDSRIAIGEKGGVVGLKIRY